MNLKAQLVDITTLDVDAIVNAANSSLAPGGGVCGAIHRAAGPELAVACEKLAPCPTGEARLTPGFRLRARHVIHAVGPLWQGGTSREADLLASAYRNSMRLARDHGLASMAFPAISTGVFGYPLAQATAIAVTTVWSECDSPGSLKDIIFACFDDDVLVAYEDAGVSAWPTR